VDPSTGLAGFVPKHACAACGAVLTPETGKAFWVSTGIGITVKRTCREGTCERDAIAGEREQPCKRIPPPPVREKDPK
jgi:hypothetical protein